MALKMFISHNLRFWPPKRMFSGIIPSGALDFLTRLLGHNAHARFQQENGSYMVMNAGNVVAVFSEV